MLACRAGPLEAWTGRPRRWVVGVRGTHRAPTGMELKLGRLATGAGARFTSTIIHLYSLYAAGARARGGTTCQPRLHGFAVYVALRFTQFSSRR